MKLYVWLVGLLIPLFCSCYRLSSDEEIEIKSLAVNSAKNASEERDLIFMLMTYAVVYQDWQELKDPWDSRGYNIGAIVVDKTHRVISWGLNEKFMRRNGTQHAEVRAIQSYLENHSDLFLEDCTLYTTLEPCAMCSGMIIMSRIERVVYGQSDPNYGHALERMQLEIDKEGYSPYPRKVASHKSLDGISLGIDSIYHRSSTKGTTKFLSSEQARNYFRLASETFLSYQAKFHVNKSILDSARSFYFKIVQEEYENSDDITH